MNVKLSSYHYPDIAYVEGTSYKDDTGLHYNNLQHLQVLDFSYQLSSSKVEND